MCDDRSIAAVCTPIICRCGALLGGRPLAPHQVQHLAWREGWIADDDGDLLCPECQVEAKCKEIDGC